MNSYTYKSYHLRGWYASLILNSVTNRWQIIQEGMHPLSVIEKFYVLKKIFLHIGEGHTLFHSMGLQNVLEDGAGVLAPPVAVKDGSFHLRVFGNRVA